MHLTVVPCRREGGWRRARGGTRGAAHVLTQLQGASTRAQTVAASLRNPTSPRPGAHHGEALGQLGAAGRQGRGVGDAPAQVRRHGHNSKLGEHSKLVGESSHGKGVLGDVAHGLAGQDDAAASANLLRGEGREGAAVEAIGRAGWSAGRAGPAEAHLGHELNELASAAEEEARLRAAGQHVGKDAGHLKQRDLQWVGGWVGGGGERWVLVGGRVGMARWPLEGQAGQGGCARAWACPPGCGAAATRLGQSGLAPSPSWGCSRRWPRSTASTSAGGPARCRSCSPPRPAAVEGWSAGAVRGGGCCPSSAACPAQRALKVMASSFSTLG